METHFTLDDYQFELQFENGSLNPDLFSHEAHLRLAWIHINRYGEAKAIDNIVRQLVAYTDALGAGDKFNKTLTIAAIKAVNHFMGKSSAVTFQEFIQQFPRLKFSFKELLTYHYQIDIYKSAQAKQEYLEPDLQPFD